MKHNDTRDAIMKMESRAIRSPCQAYTDDHSLSLIGTQGALYPSVSHLLIFILQDILTGSLFLILAEIQKFQTFLVYNSINGTIKVRLSSSLKKNTAPKTNNLDFSILEGNFSTPTPPFFEVSKFMRMYYACAGVSVGQRRVLNPLVLELQAFESHPGLLKEQKSFP